MCADLLVVADAVGLLARRREALVSGDGNLRLGGRSGDLHVCEVLRLAARVALGRHRRGDDARGRLRRSGGRGLFCRGCLLGLFLLAALRVHLLTLDDCVGDARGEEAHGPERVVVSGDDVVNAFGRAVGVNDGDDRNAEAVGLLDGDVLLAHVYDEERVREARHVLDARQVLL